MKNAIDHAETLRAEGLKDGNREILTADDCGPKPAPACPDQGIRTVIICVCAWLFLTVVATVITCGLLCFINWSLNLNWHMVRFASIVWALFFLPVIIITGAKTEGV